jgi:hypothetical protein
MSIEVALYLISVAENFGEFLTTICLAGLLICCYLAVEAYGKGTEEELRFVRNASLSLLALLSLTCFIPKYQNTYDILKIVYGKEVAIKYLDNKAEG